MPFIWTETLNTGGRLTSSQLSEIKTKTDTAATQIGITTWSWSADLTNLSTGVRIKNSLFTELHQAIDYVYDNRTCTSYNTAVLASNNTTQNTTYNGTVYSTNRVSENTTYCSSQNGAVNASNRSAENTTYCSSQNGANNGANRISENSTYCSGNNTSVNGANYATQNVTVYSVNDYAANNNKTTNYTAQNGTQNSSQNVTAYSSKNNTVNSTKNGTYSDLKLKIMLGSLTGAIDKVMTLNGYYYLGNELSKSLGLIDEGIQVGLVAQEVKEVLPEVVTDNFNSKGYMAIDYAKITTLLIEAIKEQQAQINQLVTTVNELSEDK